MPREGVALIILIVLCGVLPRNAHTLTHSCPSWGCMMELIPSGRECVKERQTSEAASN